MKFVISIHRTDSLCPKLVVMVSVQYRSAGAHPVLMGGSRPNCLHKPTTADGGKGRLISEVMDLNYVRHHEAICS